MSLRRNINFKRVSIKNEPTDFFIFCCVTVMFNNFKLKIMESQEIVNIICTRGKFQVSKVIPLITI